MNTNDEQLDKILWKLYKRGFTVGHTPDNKINGLPSAPDMVAEAKSELIAWRQEAVISELEKLDALKPETGAYLSDVIEERIAALKGEK